MPFYSDSLRLKNIALALTRQALHFPSTLADAGYTEPFIEYSLLTAHYFIPLLIPFDLDSRNETILAAVMPIIIGAFTADISGSYITSDDILRDAIGVWSFISPEQQEAYRTRVERMLRRIVVEGREFKGIIGWDNKRRAFHLQSLPMERAKSQARVAQLQSKAATLVGRVSGGGVTTLFVLDDDPRVDDV